MNWEYGDSDMLMGAIRGSQIEDSRIDGDGVHLYLSDQRVLVIVCLPSQCLGLALIKPEGVVH